MGAKLHWTQNSRTKAQTRNYTTQWILALIFLLISLFFNLQARAANPGCVEAQLMLELAQLSQSHEESDQLIQVKQELCNETKVANHAIRYANGSVATYWLGSEQAEWFYPNGKLAFKSFKKGTSIYYPNGKIATDWSHSKGVPWYHANGKLLSQRAGAEGAPLFGPQGEKLSLVVGVLAPSEINSDFNMLEFIQQVQLSLQVSSFHARL